MNSMYKLTVDMTRAKFISPVLHCILDMTDDNWTKIFSKDELKELNQVTNVEIK